MGQFCVVKHQPVAHFLLEQGRICEEQILVVVHKAHRNDAVQALAMGVHILSVLG